MKKLLKCKKGTTLIELIVGMLVFSILAVSAAAVVAPIMRVYYRANEYAEMNLLLDNLADEMTEDLNSSLDTLLSSAGLDITLRHRTVNYNVTSGILYRDTRPVLEPRYYKDKTVNITYHTQGDGLITGGHLPASFIVRIAITTSAITVSRDYAFRPLGLIDYSA